MITTLEIIDTAVKIGLGAFISGFTTYLVTKKNQEHQKNKEIKDTQYQLLLQIVEKDASGTGKLTKACLSIINKSTSTTQNFDEEIKLINEAIIDVHFASSYINLLGLHELHDHYEKKIELFADVFEEFAFNKIKYDSENIATLLNEFEKNTDKTIKRALSNAFREINKIKK